VPPGVHGKETESPDSPHDDNATGFRYTPMQKDRGLVVGVGIGDCQHFDNPSPIG